MHIVTVAVWAWNDKVRKMSEKNGNRMQYWFSTFCPKCGWKGDIMASRADAWSQYRMHKESHPECR